MSHVAWKSITILSMIHHGGYIRRFSVEDWHGTLQTTWQLQSLVLVAVSQLQLNGHQAGKNYLSPWVPGSPIKHKQVKFQTAAFKSDFDYWAPLLSTDFMTLGYLGAMTRGLLLASSPDLVIQTSFRRSYRNTFPAWCPVWRNWLAAKATRTRLGSYQVVCKVLHDLRTISGLVANTRPQDPRRHQTHCVSYVHWIKSETRVPCYLKTTRHIFPVQRGFDNYYRQVGFADKGPLIQWVLF